MVSTVHPVLQNTTVSGTAFFTLDSTSLSVSAPAVNPETHSASGLLLNTVDLAMSTMSRSAKYFEASGTILKSILRSFAPSSVLCLIVSPILVFQRPKSLAYTPVMISRINFAPVATAKSMDAIGSHNTLTP
ncbi:hypothetical protein D3C74_394500 [compost metagenome]